MFVLNRAAPRGLIGGRDSPHGVFDPWVRWDLGLDRIRSFRAVVVVVMFLKIIKNHFKNSYEHFE